MLSNHSFRNRDIYNTHYAQAQSIANFWLAFERNVTIIPVINKVDIQGVNVNEVRNCVVKTHSVVHCR